MSEKRLEVGKVPDNGRCMYRVMVTTCDERGAGTDSNITMTLFGDKGDTGVRALDSSANDFERGKVRGGRRTCATLWVAISGGLPHMHNMSNRSSRAICVGLG